MFCFQYSRSLPSAGGCTCSASVQVIQRLTWAFPGQSSHGALKASGALLSGTVHVCVSQQSTSRTAFLPFVCSRGLFVFVVRCNALTSHFLGKTSARANSLLLRVLQAPAGDTWSPLNSVQPQ